MSAVFLAILNRSIAASWLILAVVLARILLKKAPKWAACLLWGLVAVRLACPFSFESVLSLVPSRETIPADIALQQAPAIHSGIQAVNEAVNPVIAGSFAPAPGDSANPLQMRPFMADHILQRLPVQGGRHIDGRAEYAQDERRVHFVAGKDPFAGGHARRDALFQSRYDKFFP